MSLLTPFLDVRDRLWNSTGFFLIVWAVHYFPFYLMSRQLFVHHYLPSHLASSLVAGSVLSFVLSETINAPVSAWGPSIARSRKKTYADHGVKAPIIVAMFALAMFAMYIYIAPLTYGTPGYVFLYFSTYSRTDIIFYRLTGQQVNNRRLLSTWTLHFAAKDTNI